MLLLEFIELEVELFALGVEPELMLFWEFMEPEVELFAFGIAPASFVAFCGIAEELAFIEFVDEPEAIPVEDVEPGLSSCCLLSCAVVWSSDDIEADVDAM